MFYTLEKPKQVFRRHGFVHFLSEKSGVTGTWNCHMYFVKIMAAVEKPA